MNSVLRKLLALAAPAVLAFSVSSCGTANGSTCNFDPVHHVTQCAKSHEDSSSRVLAQSWGWIALGGVTTGALVDAARKRKREQKPVP